MKINGEKNCRTELDHSLKNWSKYAKVYDPVKCASIDGVDTEPHDRAVIRALNSTYKPNRFVKGRAECTIFVSRLNHETSKDTIKELFSKYGKLKRFRMVKDVVTGMPKGYAFVEFEEEQAAEEAYRVANRMVVDGNIIFVDFECERLLKGWRPRRLGGGFAGKKESGQLRFGGRDRPFKKPIALELKEKEEKQQRVKKKRREDEHRHRHDKSRERPKRRSTSFEKGRNSPLRDKAKQSLSVKEKERIRSPPRKVARLNSPSEQQPFTQNKQQSPQRKTVRQQSPESKNVKSNYSQRERVKTRSLPREDVRPKFPSRQDIKHHHTSPKTSTHHTSTQENIKRPSSPRDKAKHGSPSQKIGRQHSPLRGDHHFRENIKRNSPPRENVRSHLNYQENTNRYSAPQGEHSKQDHSPVRDQNNEHYFSTQKYFRGSVRENNMQRPPLDRNDQSHSYTRGNDNFFPREDVRYRSPIREDVKRTSPRRNDRHFSPTRENDRYSFPSRENIRYHSPVRENISRRPVSPQMEKNRRYSPIREHIKHYSPSRKYQHGSSPREIRDHSPPSQSFRNFPKQYENSNYPYYSEPQGPKHFSPVRENTRHFSPPRDVREPPHYRDVEYLPPRENTRYVSPPHENERQYFVTKENTSHYSSVQDSGNYDYFPHEQNIANFSPTREAEFSQGRNNMDWQSNPQNRGRHFHPRGKNRGGFRR